MKIAKIIVAVVAVSLSANAYALPEQVSRGQYYDHWPHRVWVWLNNPGLCVHSPSSDSDFCLGL
jgi:hypothetical protein